MLHFEKLNIDPKQFSSMSQANKYDTVQPYTVHFKTYNPVRECTIKWTVENISHVEYSNFVKLVTSKFSIEATGDWHAEIKMNDDDEFWYYLCRHNKQPEIIVEFRITISNLNGKVISKNCGTVAYTAERNCYGLIPIYCMEDDDIINDMETFTLDLKVFLPRITHTYNIENTALKKNDKQHTMSTLLKDYKGLYINQKHADVILRVNKQDTLSAHKAILSARSPVFESMFEQKSTAEQIRCIVDIEDIEIAMLKKLVSFMYCGELTDYDFETAMNVYYAAHKYAVLELLQHCGHRMVSGLTKLNAIRALTLAEQHNDQELKDEVCDFIIRQRDQDKKKKGLTNKSETL